MSTKMKSLPSPRPSSEFAESNKIFDMKISELPIAWSRSRGVTRRFKSEALRQWQEFLKSMAEEEIEVAGGTWPYPGKVSVFATIIFPEGRADRAADLDNYLKGIIDALTGTLWPDDRPKYIRLLCIDAVETEELEIVGTHLRVYSM
jgi:Holliday junction resolvase RusA-like endonuclease